MPDQFRPSITDVDTLRAEVAVSGHSAIIKVIGEIDVFTAAQLGHVIGEVELAGALDVTVHARGVTYIDCGGFRVLTSHATALQSRGGQLRLDQPSPQVVRLLELMDIFGAATSVNVCQPIPTSGPTGIGRSD